MLLDIIPENLIQQYGLRMKATNVYVNMEIRKGIKAYHQAVSWKTTYLKRNVPNMDTMKFPPPWAFRST